jgi:hypothetical protein
VIVALAWAAGASLVVWWLTRRQLVMADEAWHLVVADRLVNRHETLYRDIFYGTGPLPAWLLAASVRLAGVEIRALRSINAAVTGVLVGALWLGADHLGVHPVLASVLMVVTVLGCGPAADLETLYANLTRAAVAVAIAGALASTPAALLVAGIALGAGLASKYNIALGAAPLIALLAWTSAEQPVWLVAAAVAVALTVALAVAPVARARGGVGAMLQRLGPNKRSYMDRGRISLRSTIRLGTLAHVAPAVSVPFVVAAVLVEGVVLISGGPLMPAVVVAALVATWFLCGWPRWDGCHLRSGLPFATLALLVATTELRATELMAANAVALSAQALMIVAAGVVTVAGIRQAAQRRAFSPGQNISGFRGATCEFSPDELTQLHEARRRTGGTALVLGMSAPQAYLASGIRNPTPFDYPLASTFGPTGQAAVVAELDADDEGWVVWIDGLAFARLAPEEINQWVAQATEIVEQTGRIVVRRRRPRANPIKPSA